MTERLSLYHTLSRLGDKLPITTLIHKLTLIPAAVNCVFLWSLPISFLLLPSSVLIFVKKAPSFLPLPLGN